MTRCLRTFPSADAFNRIVLAARGGDVAPASAADDSKYLTWEHSRLPNGAVTKDDAYALAAWASSPLATFSRSEA